MSTETIEEMVQEAKAPGKFNIIEVLNNRSYPVIEVDVYFDESKALSAVEIQEKVQELEKANIRKSPGAADVNRKRIDELNKKLAEIVESISDSKYVFSITGISEAKREEMLNLAIAKHPVEFEETTAPLTGEVTRKEKDNDDRDRLFTNLLWREQISKITSPTGDIQDEITIEDIVALRGSLPIIGASKINEAIERVRIASAVFVMAVDEDFLAKS